MPRAPRELRAARAPLDPRAPPAREDLPVRRAHRACAVKPARVAPKVPKDRGDLKAEKGGRANRAYAAKSDPWA